MDNDFIAQTAARFDIPGAAVGVFHDGEEHLFCHGVTSVENPLPVDEDTLFLVGSVTKTFTATAIMRLVADGRVDLDATVRTYVPELKLADDREFTVRQLLNHTSGLDWGTLTDTGEGDDSLRRHVAGLAALKLVGRVENGRPTASPGSTWQGGSSRTSPGRPTSRRCPSCCWTRSASPAPISTGTP